MLKDKFKGEFDQSLIETTAEALKLSFMKSLTENEMPKFNDLKRAFVRHKVSDNHYVIDEICILSGEIMSFSPEEPDEYLDK